MINEKDGIVSNEEPLAIFGPFFTVKGTGLFADLAEKRIKVLSNVVTTLNREGEASVLQ